MSGLIKSLSLSFILAFPIIILLSTKNTKESLPMMKKILAKTLLITKDLFYEVALLGGAHLIYQFVSHIN